MEGKHVLGVDVGTASVRAGVFDLSGQRLASSVEAIEIHRPEENFAEQSSEDLWAATGRAVREACREAGINADSIVGLSYDATCSLVALDGDDQPVTVSPTGKPQYNIVMWMDHRAIDIAEEINAEGHEVLKYVGGKISPEMEPPKLKWIKQHLPSTWEKSGRFFDLADFMVYQSCGRDVRSLCTLVCKWGYLGHEGEFGSWDRSFYEQLGLEDLFAGDRAGAKVRPMGEYAGGLTPEAAAHLGLKEGTAVGVGIIDAHAGGLGVLGAVWEGKESSSLDELETAVAYIGGTSACLMAVSREPKFIDGVWGPYYSAMVPGLWLTEGGQSAAGGLLEYTLSDNAQATTLAKQAEQSGRSIYEILNEIVLQRVAELGPQWTKDLHVVGNHHGNRSPHADPLSKGVIDGLTIDTSLETIAKRYYATVQALAYGTREVIEAMNSNGYRIDKILACGGGTKNPVWLQAHADICECSISLPREPEAVLLGSAILAAVAARAYDNIPSAMRSMAHSGEVVAPNLKHRGYHSAKYGIFKQMYREHLERRRTMEEW
ncbi:MAG: FGGY-family carbohydrate kinase [Armatimonadetes bacterium]|nr:FGGY-family carbohydrate kinase [Armatimonadota bacterium]